MKIIVMRENLKRAFSDIEGGIGNGVILPILKNILISTEKDELKCALLI